jgi:DNA (cytosine-5)-methyltransferase 1
MKKKTLLTLSEVADMLSVSKETLRRWDASGKLKSTRNPINGYRMYNRADLRKFEQLGFLFDNDQSEEKVVAQGSYRVLELFAGAGGLALGLEQAGLQCMMLNEIDKDACKTLRLNRPKWNVVEGDVSTLNFKPFKGKVEVVTGGFPCQAFSYAGKKLGFEDARGTLFYEFARAIKETKPLVAVGENVRGLISHENGRTLRGMISILEELGYRVVEPQVLKAIFFNVPQKRERLFIVAVRKDIKVPFVFPKPCKRILTLRDALKAGGLYKTDVPVSPGQKYPKEKAEVMQLVPPGGYWRDLPLAVQKSYMKGSFYLGGGKTGMARRMSWDEPSLTLTCAPAQKQTERCHPDETRPFTVREYARIQTFPDNWEFAGALTSQYKQIGNAVPVNLAKAVGLQVVKMLNLHFDQGQDMLKVSGR